MTQLINSLFSMQGKVALVTGASSGLGEHFAKVLANSGAQVIVAARRVDRLTQLVSKIEADGGSAFAVAMDITDEQSILSGLDAGQNHFGLVDVLINNAGVGDSRYSLKVDESSWDFVMNTNLKGAWRIAGEVARRCVQAKQPASIVNIASILGLRVGFGESTYSTAKAGLVQLTKSLAMELGGKGIRVNALCPGYFATELNQEYLHSDAGKAFLAKTPSGRMGKLEELSAPLLLLASDAGSFINGTTLPVDGGHLVTPL